MLNKRNIIPLLVIASSTLLAFLLIGHLSCDGDFYRHFSRGEMIFNERNFPAPGPGYYFPLMDIWVGFLMQQFGSTSLVNGVSFVLYLASLALFYGIVQIEVKRESIRLPVVAAAFAHPVMIVAGGNFGDYIYSVFFVMLSWYLLLKDHSAWAAFALALGAGFRMTTGIWLIPLALLCYQHGGRKKTIEFVGLTLGISYFVWHGYFIRAGSLNPLVILRGASGYDAGIPMTVATHLTSAFSKLIHLLGIPLVILAGLALWKNGLKAWVDILKSQKMLLITMLLYIALFIKMPYELGYLITLIPVLILLIPKTDKPLYLNALVLVVFSLNFIVIGLQFQIPSKFHLARGYYVSEYTCRDCSTPFELFRFSIPKNSNGEDISPAGDWAANARPCGQ